MILPFTQELSFSLDLTLLFFNKAIRVDVLFYNFERTIHSKQ